VTAELVNMLRGSHGDAIDGGRETSARPRLHLLCDSEYEHVLQDVARAVTVSCGHEVVLQLSAASGGRAGAGDHCCGGTCGAAVDERCTLTAAGMAFTSPLAGDDEPRPRAAAFVDGDIALFVGSEVRGVTECDRVSCVCLRACVCVRHC
jgi:hypothetical protein